MSTQLSGTLSYDFNFVGLDINNPLYNHSGIYLMKNKKGEILYVGKSKHIGIRLKQHLSKSSSNTSSFIEEVYSVEACKKDIEQIDFLEMIAVDLLDPIYNHKSISLSKEHETVYKMAVEGFSQKEIGKAVGKNAYNACQFLYSDFNSPERKLLARKYGELQGILNSKRNNFIKNQLMFYEESTIQKVLTAYYLDEIGIGDISKDFNIDKRAVNLMVKGEIPRYNNILERFLINLGKVPVLP